VYVPPVSGLKIEASPSRISNQSLPNASRMFGLRLLAADQPRRFHRTEESAGVRLPDRNRGTAEHLTDRFRVGATLVVRLALPGDIVEVQGVGVGLIGMRGAMADDDHVSPGAK